MPVVFALGRVDGCCVPLAGCMPMVCLRQDAFVSRWRRGEIPAAKTPVVKEAFCDEHSFLRRKGFSAAALLPYAAGGCPRCRLLFRGLESCAAACFFGWVRRRCACSAERLARFGRPLVPFRHEVAAASPIGSRAVRPSRRGLDRRRPLFRGLARVVAGAFSGFARLSGFRPAFCCIRRAKREVASSSLGGFASRIPLHPAHRSC